MTCTAMPENRMMSHSASASCANAGSFCANLVILDAILLASIFIICAGGIAIAGMGLVLAVLLVREKEKMNDAAWARKSR